MSSGQSRTVSGRSCRARVAGVGFGWSLLVMWGTRDGRTVPVSPESTRSWLRGRCSARSHRGRIGTDVKGDGWHHPSTESSPSPSCRRAVSRGRERLRILDAVGSPIPRHHPTDRSHRAVALLGLSDLPTCARCRIRKPPLVPAAAPGASHRTHVTRSPTIHHRLRIGSTLHQRAYGFRLSSLPRAP